MVGFWIIVGTLEEDCGTLAPFSFLFLAVS
jgi:hypothetical protein